MNGWNLLRMRIMSRPRLWTRNFILNTTINFVIFIVYYLFMVIIAIHASEHLHASSSEAGLAAGIFILAALPSRIFAGMMIEVIGRKRMLVIGSGIFLIATLLYSKADCLFFLYIVRILHGIGWGIATTCTATIIAYIIPDERRGEGIGYYSMSNSLASSIGPLIGMNLYQHVSFRAIIFLSIVLMVFIFLMLFFLKVPRAELTREQIANMKGIAFRNFFEVKVLPIAVVGLVVYFSYSSIVSFLSSYAKEIHLIYAGSYFFVVYSAAILISRMISGRLFDKKGENFVMYPSFLLFAIGLVTISQAENGFVLLLAGALMGVGFGTFASSSQAIAIKLVSDHRKGLATSTFQAISDMGIGIGPSILGFMIPVTGFRGLYVCMAGVVISAMFLYYFVYARAVKELR